MSDITHQYSQSYEGIVEAQDSKEFSIMNDDDALCRLLGLWFKTPSTGTIQLYGRRK